MSAKTFSLAELADLANCPVRTVRYYIQIGLLPRPIGAGRGAHYAAEHLEKLLEIQKWQRAGLSLDRIAELLTTPEEGAVPVPPTRPGDVSVRSHLQVAEGIELVVDPGAAKLSSEALRNLYAQVIELFRDANSATEPKETKP